MTLEISIYTREGDLYQGKVIITGDAELTEVCAPRFWNQGKVLTSHLFSSFIVCAPRFWNQGKVDSHALVNL